MPLNAIARVERRIGPPPCLPSEQMPETAKVSMVASKEERAVTGPGPVTSKSPSQFLPLGPGKSRSSAFSIALARWLRLGVSGLGDYIMRILGIMALCAALGGCAIQRAQVAQ